MFSRGGEFIYILVAADEYIIANEAERSAYEIQLELGASDLESLQPCDQHLRPYRILRKQSNQEIEDLEAELKEFYKEIFAGSDDMRLHGMNDSLMEDDEEKDEDELFEPTNVSAEKWQTYKFYLSEVKR